MAPVARGVDAPTVACAAAVRVGPEDAQVAAVQEAQVADPVVAGALAAALAAVVREALVAVPAVVFPGGRLQVQAKKAGATIAAGAVRPAGAPNAKPIPKTNTARAPHRRGAKSASPASPGATTRSTKTTNSRRHLTRRAAIWARPRAVQFAS